MSMSDTWRCRNCEVLISTEYDVCEDCHTDYISWLEETDKQKETA